MWKIKLSFLVDFGSHIQAFYFRKFEPQSFIFGSGIGIQIWALNPKILIFIEISKCLCQIVDAPFPKLFEFLKSVKTYDPKRVQQNPKPRFHKLLGRNPPLQHPISTRAHLYQYFMINIGK